MATPPVTLWEYHVGTGLAGGVSNSAWGVKNADVLHRLRLRFGLQSGMFMDVAAAGARKRAQGLGQRFYHMRPPAFVSCPPPHLPPPLLLHLTHPTFSLSFFLHKGGNEEEEQHQHMKSKT